MVSREESLKYLYDSLKEKITEETDPEHQEVILMQAIIYEAKRRKIEKLTELQVKFNSLYISYVKKVKIMGQGSEEEKAFAKWPIEFYPDPKDKKNLKKGITHLHVTVSLIDNWWKETNNYEEIIEAGKIFSTNRDEIYTLYKKYLIKKQITRWSTANEIPSLTPRYNQELNNIAERIDKQWNEFLLQKDFPLPPIINVGFDGDNFRMDQLSATLNSDPNDVTFQNNNQQHKIMVMPGNQDMLLLLQKNNLALAFGAEWAETFIAFFVPPFWSFSWELYLTISGLTSTDSEIQTRQFFLRQF